MKVIVGLWVLGMFLVALVQRGMKIFLVRINNAVQFSLRASNVAADKFADDIFCKAKKNYNWENDIRKVFLLETARGQGGFII